MERPRTRGPYAKTAARRVEIVRAARDSFAANGFERSTLRDIAARAGITHTGLLHHFADKDELLMAVMAQRDVDDAAGSAAQGTSESAAEFLLALLREHQSSPELMRLWTELAAAGSRPSHPAHATLVERYARAREMAARDERPIWAADPSALAPELFAPLLLAILDGLQLQWLLDPDLDILTPLEAFLRLAGRV